MNVTNYLKWQRLSLLVEEDQRKISGLEIELEAQNKLVGSLKAAIEALQEELVSSNNTTHKLQTSLCLQQTLLETTLEKVIPIHISEIQSKMFNRSFLVPF